MSRDEMSALQGKRLNKLVNLVYHNVPFYRNKMQEMDLSPDDIQTIEDIPVDEIKYVQGKEVINLRGTVIPIIRLGGLLDVPNSGQAEDSLTVVVIKKGDKQAGLVVDELIGQMEIVIKCLGKYIHINKMISGASILGDGEVALIIDANAIV